MGFKLDIFFSGLCGFVPIRDSAGGSKSMWVMMPNRASVLKGRAQPPVHSAVMVIDPREVHGTTWEADRITLVWKLYAAEVGYDLKILPGGSACPDSLQYIGFDPVKDRNLFAPQDPSYYQSFYWVAPTEPACQDVNHKGAGCIHPDFLAPSPVKNRDLLAARMLVNAGAVSCSSLATSKDLRLALWKFGSYDRSVAGSRKTVVASVVKASMHVPADYVEFRAGKLDGTVGSSIRLAPADGAGAVTVAVLNEESDEIVDANVKNSPLIKNRPRIKDRIYEGFFDLATPANMPKEHRPIPIFTGYTKTPPLKADTGYPAAVSPPCSPGRYPTA